jgi:hypothetical protein
MIEQLFEIAAKVGTIWSLAAFSVAAIVAVVSIIAKARGKNAVIAYGAFCLIGMIGLAPFVAHAYLDTHGVYRVRVNVVNDHNLPVDDARVTSSIGAEVKKVDGGWELDIPPGAKPKDGKLTVRASQLSAFLQGHTDTILNDDFNPVTTVTLIRDTSAEIHGIILDQRSQPVSGVSVGVVGFEAESTSTGVNGTFTLAAHAAEGQQVELYARKDHFGSTTSWSQAGNFPVTIVLKNQ